MLKCLSILIMDHWAVFHGRMEIFLNMPVKCVSEGTLADAHF